MEEQVARQIMKQIEEINAALNGLMETIEGIGDEEERKHYRKSSATVVSSIYADLMRPIIRDHPGLDPDSAP